MSNSTPITDGFGRTVSIAGSDAETTPDIGLYPLMNFMRQHEVLDLLHREVAPTLPVLKCRGGLSQYQKFCQRFIALLTGWE